MSFVDTPADNTIPIAVIVSSLGSSDPYNGKTVYLDSKADDAIIKAEIKKVKAAEGTSDAGVPTAGSSSSAAKYDSGFTPLTKSISFKRKESPNIGNWWEQRAKKLKGQQMQLQLEHKAPAAPTAEEKKKALMERLASALKEHKQTSIELDAFELFDPLINPGTRDVVMITGPAGCGKSTLASEYCTDYYRNFPENPIYIFSAVNYDKVFDQGSFSKNVQRISIGEEMLDKPIEPTELANSMCVFDDIDHVPDEYVKCVAKLRDKLLEIGRHDNIYVVATSHLFFGGIQKTSVMKRECNKVCFFSL